MLEKKLKKTTLKEVLILPEREERTESPLFRKNKVKLKRDGHWKCFICNSIIDLEVHHYGCEYSLRDACDFIKLKEFCESHDTYGYGKVLRNIPITSVDDIRNCMVLCREHHLSSDSDGVANGFHNITFPTWIIQKLQKDGENVVPENTKELEEEMNKPD